MCSRSAIKNLLWAITALLVAAIAATFVAITTNTNFITSAATPFLLGGVLATLAACIALVGKLIADVRGFHRCVNFNGGTNFCRGQLDRLIFALSAMIGLLAGNVVLISSILAIAWVPGTAIPVLGKAAVALIALKTGNIAALHGFLSSYIACLLGSPAGVNVLPLKGSRVTPPPSPPKPTGSVAVGTCPLNTAVCPDGKIQLARKTTTYYLTAKSFVVLFKTPNNLAIQKKSAFVTDAYRHRVQLDLSRDFLESGTHTVLDSSYHVIRVRWDYISSKGIQADITRTSRRWKVNVELTLSDGSRDSIQLEVMVSN